MIAFHWRIKKNFDKLIRENERKSWPKTYKWLKAYMQERPQVFDQKQFTQRDD